MYWRIIDYNYYSLNMLTKKEKIGYRILSSLLKNDYSCNMCSLILKRTRIYISCILSLEK